MSTSTCSASCNSARWQRKTTIVEGKGSRKILRPVSTRSGVNWKRPTLIMTARSSGKTRKARRRRKRYQSGSRFRDWFKEKKHRFEDALAATRAAVEEGMVPGGGVTYVNVLNVLDEVQVEGDEKVGVNIVRRALEEPLRQIAQNAGLEGSIIVEKVKTSDRKGWGLNAVTEEFVEVAKSGIVDPLKVARSALENAASVASMLLTTEAVIAKSLRRKRHLLIRHSQTLTINKREDDHRQAR